MRTEQYMVEEPVFLLERLMESCEDDVALAHEVLEDFQESAPRCLSRLTAAVMASDPVLVRLESHSLKGSASTIGAKALASVSARLETMGDLSDAPTLLAEAGQRLKTLHGVLTTYLADY